MFTYLFAILAFQNFDFHFIFYIPIINGVSGQVTDSPVSAHCLVCYIVNTYRSHICTTQSPNPRWWGGSRDRAATGIKPATCRPQDERPAPQTTRPPRLLNETEEYEISRPQSRMCNAL